MSGRFGANDSEPGVIGTNENFQGVSGTSTSDTGVFGASQTGRGVHGNCDPGPGVFGTSKTGEGVLARSVSGQGVTAFSDNDVGLFAQGGTFAGVFKGALVVGKGADPADPGVQRNQVNGSIVINDGGSLFLNGGGDVILGNADCAEDFDVSAAAIAEPGSVMVLDDKGTLSQCTTSYEKRVVGVLSGVGQCRPGLVLDRHPERHGRAPLALIGKVYCKADAQYGSIEVGDLLTTSATTGHAMKAIDPQKSFGTVIGKALQPLRAGRGLVAIFVALQ